ncbi:MutS domain-containing protein [Spironucleus salmonicida]|uniref:MutS domain-containing protein n=1 Tax=Spironucleus salmonicida TaxID=348837 RepID=V6LGD9_9EUKA|nr:MutS domain-containing protein [Spironucleus salmonicida]|eukprot:EST43592.1 MutS domain-containing protein [Spironucleus salmonicida]
MQLNNTVSQQELQDLLRDLPSFFKQISKQQFELVTFISFENFYVSPNFTPQESSQYYLSQTECSVENLPDKTISISIFHSQDLNPAQALAFSRNLPVHLYIQKGQSMELVQVLTPSQQDISIAAVFIMKQNYELISSILAITNRQLIAVQVIDDLMLTKTTSLLNQINVKQVNFKSLDYTVTQIFDSMNIFYKEIKDGIKIDINIHLRLKLKDIYLDQFDYLIPIIGDVFQETQISTDLLNLDYFEILTADIDQFLKISQQDLIQLDLPDIKQLYSKKTITDSGKMITDNCFKQVLTEQNQILIRQIVYQKISNQNPKELLKKCINLHRTYNNIFIKQTNSFLRENLILRQYLQEAPEFLYYLNSIIQDNFIPEFEHFITNDTQINLSSLSDLINDNIMPNDQIFDLIDNFNEVFLNPNIDENLIQIFHNMQLVYQDMISHLNLFLTKLATIQTHFRFSIFNKQLTIQTKVLAYSQEIQDLCDDNDLQLSIVQQRAKLGIRFTTSILKPLSERFFALISDYKECSQPFIVNLKRQQFQFSTPVLNFSKTVGFIDFFASAAQISSIYQFNLAIFSNEFFNGTDLFNPILLQNSTNIIKNSFKLNSNSIFITGANSGGKSTLLKAISISIFLSQIGIPGPFQSCEFKPIKSLRTCFANSDDINSKMSTFANEVNALNTALIGCQNDCLVVIDELGRGTSLGDGFGLSVASLKEIQNRNGKFICISHLKEVWADFKDCEKWKMGENNYKVSLGETESKGLDVAEKCGFSQHIIQIARKFQGYRGGNECPQSCEINLDKFDVEKMEQMLVGFACGKYTANEIKEFLGEVV